MSSLVVKIAAEKNLVTILEKICEGYQFSFHGISDEMRIEEFHLTKPDIIFANSNIIEKVYDSLNGDNYRPSLFVTTNDSDLELPNAFIHGKADDLFTLPPRKSEFLSKVKLHHHLEQLKEIEISTKAVPELVKKLQEDLALAEKVQRRLIKDKFDPIHGVTIKSKYWCGLKSGGDYFDVFDFGDGAHIGFLLTDCSSYSLSTAFLSSLMQLSLGMKNTDVEHPKVIVEKIFDQIKGSMKPKDKLSICFGVLNRKDFKFKFVTYGNVFLARKQPENSIDWLYNGIENPPITIEAGVKGLPREVVLEPEERILFFSDGWQECLSGAEFNELVHRLGAEEKDSQNFINEMAFRLRRGLEKASDEPVTAESDFPMPMQDCSVLLVDMPRNVIRLTAVK